MKRNAGLDVNGEKQTKAKTLPNKILHYIFLLLERERGRNLWQGLDMSLRKAMGSIDRGQHDGDRANQVREGESLVELRRSFGRFISTATHGSMQTILEDPFGKPVIS